MQIKARDRLEGVLARLNAGARDEKGVAAVIFALAVAVLTPMALGVFDVYLASEQRGKLQDALDAAALYAARSNAQTSDQIDAIGDKALAANLKLINGATLKGSTFSLSGTKVVAQASVELDAFAPAFFDHKPVQVDTEVQRSIDRLEIALVLDNTGSMVLNNSPKLATLKTEAKKLVDKLALAASMSAEPTPIKIALVPFSNTVRVQDTTSLATYNTASHTGPGVPSWIDPQGKQHYQGTTNNDIFDVQHTDRLTMMKNIGQSWAGCVESRRQPYDISEEAPATSTPASMFVPWFWPDEPDVSGTPKVNDYIADGGGSDWKAKERRSAKYATGVWKRTGSFTTDLGMTYTHGPNAGCTLQPMIRLTTDMSAVKTAIDNMTAIGETNIPLGMVWGWHAVTPNAPLADGGAYGTPHLKKIVILMTDGENTMYDSEHQQ
ncbi:pilus assembly protein TadG-related protein [Phenylobacterium sp. J367]|uniref:TadE/TadG family type IV pilus assembly protein n=1 Tax=Phenylobacterium sp. J367 TaxID=2898435 RepID=UPI0021511643|nr:pilus assembly protein TadG-related protein [Phenylobacterium sp. J367]MCR5877777.1 pilus assembly protein TadG-related protein [Phenylobacterium sp. J367]